MRAAVVVFALVLGACLESPNLSDRTFPCRGAADCVEGFVCHPSRFVCVAAGAVVLDDAGPIVRLDATAADAAIVAPDARPVPAADAEPTKEDDAAVPDTGVPPDGGVLIVVAVGERCGSMGMICSDRSTCVDGVCCQTACDGVCERCILGTGECGAYSAGRDPDAECPDLDCATLTYGLIDNVCYAYRADTRPSTCDGNGGCTDRPTSCEGTERGLAIATCGTAECVATGACAADQPIASFDSAAELCGGMNQSCSSTLGVEPGCCGPSGTCCPMRLCAANACP